MSDSELRIVTEEVDGTGVVRIAGEIDLTNADSIERAIGETTAGRVVLDLAEVEYLDSSGIRAIDRGYRHLAAQHRSLAMVAPPDTAAGWTFRVAGFDRRLLYDSVDAALVAMASSDSA